MLQGTASSAGKSLMTAAFCRIFSNDGYKVCPFKSQNMSLNSYVTMEGLEMGRAQVLQAQAGRAKPIVAMNPILLKPTSDRKCQVILNGKPFKNMDAQEYFDYKRNLKEMIKETYSELEKDCDIVVIEGAGSPAEINLKSEDIVNMGMAKIADSPVILVADIDKGGVFASIYGTVMLLEEDERKRIKGIIINKFRGDKGILQSGLDMIEKLVNIPVIGVMPYIYVKLDEEDGAVEFNGNGTGEIDICVIKLPRVSNFTDFDAFKFDEDVNVRYITTPKEIGSSDILIIPGSKNTIEDLRWLKRAGFEDAIKSYRGILFGICGGYQMMGSKIVDTEGWEVTKGETETGLNIFDSITELKGEKITTNVEGEIFGHRVYGYEIHCGKTIGAVDSLVRINLKEGQEVYYFDGEVKNKRYYGTYIHGVFDSNEFREFILNGIRREKSLEEKSSVDLMVKREEELERLAEAVRENVDMDFVYRIIKGK